MNKGSFLALRLASCAVVLCAFLFHSATFGQVSTFQRFDTQSSFIVANSNPIVVSYDSFPNVRFATYEQTFATEGVKIKPNDPNYTNPLWPNDWTTLLPGKELAITGKEGMEFNFTTPVNAFGYDFVERVASIPGYETAFTDSTFVVSVYNGTTKLTEYTFTPANDVASFFGVSSSQNFDKVIIQETVGSIDDELYGKLYIKRNAGVLTCPTGQTKTPDPKSPVCIVRAIVKDVQDTDFILTGYDHLAGNCTLSSVVPQAPQTGSNQISVLKGEQRTAWAQSSPWPFQLDSLLTCPAGAVKKSCEFTSGAGPLGEIVCACYLAGVTPPLIVQEPTYSCVTDSTCSEGQYWCNSENTCKSAGQSCTLTCNTSTPVSWTQFSNPSPGNINSPSAPSLGSASGTIQLGGKTIQVSYAGDVRSVGIASNWSWIWTGNTAPFLSTLVSNIPDPAHLLGVFGGSQAMNTLTFSEPVTDPILLFYSIGGGGVNITYEFDRPFTIVSGSTGMTGMGDFVNPSGNILRGAEGYGVIQFHGTFSALSFKVPTAEYWSAFTVGIKEASTCPVSLTCNNNNTCETGESCNCGDCTNGGTDDKDRCGVSNGSQMLCTKDKQNTTTTGGFNATTAQANFNIVNGKLATYLSSIGNLNIAAGEFGSAATELKITQDTRLDAATSFTKEEAWTRTKELLAIPANAQVLWSQTSTKYFNNALGVNERYLYSYVIQQSSGVQKQIFFATEFLPGYGWRKVYTVSKDYPLSTTPTGAEVCQNFTNPRLFLKPVASYQSPAQFCLEQGFRGTSTIINDTYMTGTMTMWNAAGTAWVPNDNGDRIDEIRCCGVPLNATAGAIQVGACCPVGTEWSSTANACVTDKCGEGQYYCHEELKCKPANEPCSAVVCEDKVVFNYTGAVQNYTVPTDVSKIQIKAWGAAGGSGSSPWTFVGASGGYAQGDIGVTGGEQFKIVVGEGGKRASTLRTFGGGGHGTASWGGSGGGLSGIFRNSFTHANSLLIAGGGSGASGGGNIAEGFGGGLQGNRSMLDYFSAGYANGGTQTAGGVSVAPYSVSLAGASGGPLSGGDANNWTCTDGGAGGGGGGYYGGAGGVGDWCTFPASGDTDGGGGSGYLHTSLTNASFATTTTADAKTAPKKTDADYVTGVAEGKNTGDGSGGNGLVVITECRPKSVATCNNNGTCDTNESCNCADCNDKVDHCAINGTGEQLICTKDTTPPCFADKFPYCFPACLDGYTRNASGQCVSNATIAGGNEQWIAYLGAYYIYLAKTPVETNTVGGETFYVYNPEKVIPLSTMSKAAFLANPITAIKNAPTLPIGTAPLASRNIFNLAQLQSESTTIQNSTLQYITQFIAYRYLCRENKAGSTKCSYNNELVFSPGIGTNLGGDIYAPATGDDTYIFYAKSDILGTYDIGSSNIPTTLPATEKWEARSYSSAYIMLSKHPIPTHTVAGQTFYIYNPERLIRNMTKAQFVADPTTAIRNATVLPIGRAIAPMSRVQFNMPQLLSETLTVQATTVTNLKSSVLSRFLCATLMAGANDCHYNNLGGTQYPGFSYTTDGPIYGSIHDGDGYIQTTAYQRFGTFEIACQPYDKTTVTYVPNTSPVTQGWSWWDGTGTAQNDGGKLVWQVNDANGSNGASLSKKPTTQEITQFYTQGGKLSAEIKNLSSGTVTSPTNAAHLMASYLELSVGQTTNTDGSIRPRKRFTLTFGMDATRTPTVYAFTDADYDGTTSYKYTVTGGEDKYNLYEMVYDPLTNTVDVLVNGIERISNYPGNIVTSGNLQAANQINVYFGSGSSPGVAKTNYGDVQLTIRNASCNSPVVTPPTTPPTITPSSTIQTGACCPPGSAWNSVENRCVPSTCGVGQFYCAAQKKCLPGGTTCDTTVCNNNGLCEGEESCQCGDCVDGPTQTDPTKKADDKDKCSIIGGIQAMCSDDIPTDNKPGACCLPPQTWNTATGTCQECTNTQAPSELKAGVDQPYISCTGNGDTTQTHFKYRITPLTGSLPITPTVTSTNSALTVTKLLAKAVGGVCPTDASAYVSNLTGVVSNDKVCVRLVYNNATTGAVSNALITDSLPTGFTRITNSTKNCLTPTGSSELCSDASDMGGAIGNNGWSGNNFSLTPHAGFYAIPTNKTTGDVMDMGKKRYLINCTAKTQNLDFTQVTHSSALGAVNVSPGFTSKENNWSITLNPQPTNVQCASLINHPSPDAFWNNTDSGYQPSQVDILGRKNLLSCNLSATNAGGYNYNVYLPMVAVNSNPGFTNHTTNYGPVTPQATNAQCAALAGYPYASLVYNNTTYSGQPGQIDLTEGRYLVSCMWNGYNNIQYLSHRAVNTNPGFTSKESNWPMTLNPQPTNTQCAQLVGHSTGGEFQNTGGSHQPYQTDLLDTTNGKGYIQYMVEATATPSNLALPSATLAGTTTTADTSSANATINVSANAATGTPYTSINSFAVGTQVLHTATPFTEGTYKVECFYGTSTNVLVDPTATPHACVKNINVKAANDSTAQGCSRILAYRDSTLSNEMASPGGFKATFRCGSRLPVTEAVTNPYQFRFGTNPIATLQYDSIISEFFNGLGIGPVSTQTQNYDIPNNNTDISCAMKVGGGYSTNNACKTTTCVGATCSLPQTFSVVNSQNVTCTPDASSEYDIGCNSAADDTTRKFCAKWFKDAFDNRPNKSVSDFQTYFTFGGAHALIDCTQYTANDPRFGGLNMYENFVCTTTLPNGEKVEIFGAEKKPDNSIGAIAALQTTAYTVKRDTDKPVLSALKFYSGSTVSESTYIADQSRWQKSPVTAAVTCTNTPFSDGNYCVCAPHVAAVSTVAGIPGTTTPDLWSSGIPDATVGADIMRYTRTITTSLNGATVAVRDTAGNISPDARTISIGVDTVAPTVNITTTGTAPSLAVTITATDNTGGSGIWKDNIQTQTYLATAPVPTFDDKCNVTSSDTLLYESYSPTGTPLALTKSTATPITLNTSTHKLAYCIQDNAGNITKGFYPSVPVACFSSTNLPTVPGTTPSAIPSIATYVAPLIARIAPATGVGQFGYGMNTDATNANCFRGIITSNVTRLISNQYNASTASTVDWSAPAKVKSNPTLSNTNGYYYHTAMSPNLLTINTSPSGTGPKVVYAEGADIQINADINYRDSSTTTNSNTLLIIIAKRATSGANPAGGNIYINPSVKNIDAILITDGAIMNGVNGLAKDYITNPTDLINRLTINGRIYSMNTRGGSIDSSILTSNNLGMITTNSGKVFANNASLTTNATPAQAAAQDLERFRVINDDGNKQCTLFLNYKTIPINTLPPILQRPSGYAGGGCGF